MTAPKVAPARPVLARSVGACQGGCRRRTVVLVTQRPIPRCGRCYRRDHRRAHGVAERGSEAHVAKIRAALARYHDEHASQRRLPLGPPVKLPTKRGRRIVPSVHLVVTARHWRALGPLARTRVLALAPAIEGADDAAEATMRLGPLERCSTRHEVLELHLREACVPFTIVEVKP